MHERVSPAEATCGFPGLLKGTKLLGCALITDRGFCRELAAKYAKAGILSPREWCEAHNVLFLWPFTEDDDVGLVYDPTTHRLNIVPKDEAKVSHEQLDHLIPPKSIIPPTGAPISHSHLCSPGPSTELVSLCHLPACGCGAVPRCLVEDLARPTEEATHPHERCGQAQDRQVLQLVSSLLLFLCSDLTDCLCSWHEEGDTEWGEEQAEMAEWSLDYQSAVQIYNKYHAKFYRSHPDWFQVAPNTHSPCSMYLMSLPCRRSV